MQHDKKRILITLVCVCVFANIYIDTHGRIIRSVIRTKQILWQTSNVFKTETDKETFSPLNRISLLQVSSLRLLIL